MKCHCGHTLYDHWRLGPHERGRCVKVWCECDQYREAPPVTGSPGGAS